LLSRRTNIKSTAEIAAERAARQPKPAPIIIAPPSRYISLTSEQKLERNQRIKDLWLAGNNMREISEITEIPPGTVCSVIVKLGLQGRGGKRKKFIKRRYKNPQADEHA
jgi:hypothetical protein